MKHSGHEQAFPRWTTMTWQWLLLAGILCSLCFLLLRITDVSSIKVTRSSTPRKVCGIAASKASVVQVLLLEPVVQN